MIHIATVHHQSDKWIDIQLDYLARALDEPYLVWASCEGIDEGRTKRFDRVIPSQGPHPGKLNLLALAIAQEAAADDLIVFLDGDAFPIADPMPVVRSALETTGLVAVRRDENAGDPQPHPCFCVTTVGFWHEIGGDWSRGHTWTRADGAVVTDTGANLMWALDQRLATWTPLLRSNRVNLHPLFFGIYGDVVYHHGAGFRRMISRADLAAAGKGTKAPTTSFGRFVDSARRLLSTRSERGNRKLSDEIYEQIRRNPDFYTQFQ